MPRGVKYGNSNVPDTMKANKPMAKKKTSTIKIGDKKITMKKDALRNMLKVPEDEDIPVSFLNKIGKADAGDMIRNIFTGKEMKVSALMKKRASLAKTLKSFKK